MASLFSHEEDPLNRAKLILKEDDLETLLDSVTFRFHIIQQKEILMLENIKTEKRTISSQAQRLK